MTFPAAYPAHLICFKTDKGREEMAQRCFGLDMRQRRVLIMMDGTKSLDDIRDMMPSIGLDAVFACLIEEGFVAASASAALASTPSTTLTTSTTSNMAGTAQRGAALPSASVTSIRRQPAGPAADASAGPSLLQDPQQIRQVKDFMTTTATTYLGLLSADVIRRIERAEGAAQLLTVVGPWHMALRESRQGNRFAGPYLDQVTTILSGKEAPVAVM